MLLTSDHENEPSYRSSQEIGADDGRGRIGRTRGAQQQEEEEERVELLLNCIDGAGRIGRHFLVHVGDLGRVAGA